MILKINARLYKNQYFDDWVFIKIGTFDCVLYLIQMILIKKVMIFFYIVKDGYLFVK